VVDSNHSREQSGRKVSRVLFDVPYGAARVARTRTRCRPSGRSHRARREGIEEG
jgi:hypothetical protein